MGHKRDGGGQLTHRRSAGVVVADSPGRHTEVDHHSRDLDRTELVVGDSNPLEEGLATWSAANGRRAGYGHTTRGRVVWLLLPAVVIFAGHGG